MDEDNAIGFSIKIPENIFKDLEKVDNAIKGLQTTADKTADGMKQAFINMASSTKVFLDSLDAIKSKFGEISAPNLPTRLDSSNQSMISFTEAVNKAITALNELDKMTSSRKPKDFFITKDEAKKITSSIDDLAKKYVALSKAYDKYSAAKAKADSSDRSNNKAIDMYNRAMAASEATINQRINKMAKLRNAQEQLIKTGRDYTAELSNIKREMARLNKENEDAANSTRNVHREQKRLVDISSQLARKLALVFSVSQVSGYLKNMVAVRGEFELQSKSLEIIIQNKEKANQLFDQITQLAVKSPFQLKELVSYTKQLAAYRVETSKLYDTTKMLADISAGLGVDMSRLILAYGQVKAANYLRGTELRQFSEAGVNILGELSKYFTELKGEMVSVGDVFEMVSKRMVSFKDVETIFKRLTSEGGIFYQMQEKQSETLAGQMSNLRDSLDIMFNEIGKANDGVLKDSVGAVRKLIENWRAVSVALKTAGVALGLYILKAKLATSATSSFATATGFTVAQLKGMGRLQKISLLFDTLKIKLRDLGNVIKTNAFTLLATAVTAAGYAIYEYNDKIERARKSYDNLSNSITDNKAKLNSLVNQYRDNTTEINRLKSNLDNLESDTDEYRNTQEELNKVQKENNVIIAKLRADFPKLSNNIEDNKDSLEKLTKAQKDYNDEANLTLGLNYAMQSRETWFNEGIKKDLADLNEENVNYNKTLEETRGAYQSIVIEAQRASLEQDSASKDTADKILAIANGVGTLEEKLISIKKEAANVPHFTGSMRRIYNSSADALDKLSKQQTKLNNATKEATEEVSEAIKYTLTSAKAATEEEFRLLSDEAKKPALNAAKAFIDQIPDIKSKFIQDFVNQQFNVRLGVSFDFEGKVEEEYKGIQKEIKEYGESHKLKTEDIIKPDESMSAYFNNLRKKYDELTKEINKLGDAERRRQTNATNEEEKKNLEEYRKEIYAVLRAYNEFQPKQKVVNKENKIWSERIQLIKKVGEEYDKLRDHTGAMESADAIRENYKEAFDNLDMGSLFATMTFDTDGIVEALNKVGESATNEVKKDISKMTAELNDKKVNIQIGIERTKDIDKVLDDMFAKYDLGKELEKEGIGKEIGEQLFNIKAFNLEELKDNVDKYEKSFDELGREQIKKFDEARKKITEMDAKELQQREKTYVKYLKKSMSERIAIEMEAQKKIAEMQSVPQLTPEQKKTIKEAIEKERDKSLDQLEWKEFKGTDMYISMFEDLERTSTASLDVMLDKLNQLRGSLHDLTPTELKDITAQIKKIQNELEDRNPFRDFLPSLREYIDYLKQRNQLDEDYKKSVEKEDNLKSNYESAEDEVRAREDIYQKAKKTYGIFSEEASMAKIQLTLAKKKRDSLEKEYTDQKKITDNIINQIKHYKDLGKKLSVAFSAASSYANEMIGTIDSVADSVESVFGTMSDKARDAIDSTKEILGGLGETAGGIGRILSGDVIGGMMGAVSGLAKTIGSIFRIGDKKKERQIQREIKAVEKLEKAYSKLEKAINDAYSVDSIKEANKAANESIRQQIQAYKRMIKLEDDKKKTDHKKIEAWNEQIEELETMLKENEENMIESLGGFGSESNFKSAAEEFANAWYEAFKETGDGMSGLEDTFDSFMDNVVKKQLLIRGTEKILEPLLNMVDNAVKGGVVTKEKLDAIFDKFNTETKQALNDWYKALMGNLGVEGGKGQEDKGDRLSGLSKGIQSITEQTALALEALLNSMRFFVADSNLQIKNILNALVSPDTLQNPILAELKTHTKLISSINDLFGSVVGSGHPVYGGKFLKVSM